MVLAQTTGLSVPLQILDKAGGIGILLGTSPIFGRTLAVQRAKMQERVVKVRRRLLPEESIVVAPSINPVRA